MASSGYNAGVFRRQGGNEMVVSSGATMQFDAGAVLNFASGVTLTGFPGEKDLSANLFGGRVLASGETIASGSTAPTAFFGGLLMPDGAPALTQSTVDHNLYLNWASAIVTALKCLPFTIPVDLATASGLTIELKGESIGTGTASDAAAAFDIRCWSGLGDTEMGATHADFSSTPAWKGITLASGDITTGLLNWTLVPQAHNNRALRIYGARARYARKTA